MADRRRNPDLSRVRSWRDIAERCLRVLVVGGAIAGWALAAQALRAHFSGG